MFFRTKRFQIFVLTVFCYLFIAEIFRVIRLNLLLSDDDGIDTSEIVIYSAYYYPTSKSLGNNSVALVMTADYKVAARLGELNVTVSNEDTVVNTVSKLQRVTPHEVCRWISIMATVPTLPNLQAFSVNLGDRNVQIPITSAARRPQEMVSCIAPLFANEQWQLIIYAAHINKRYGSYMHMYVRSVVKPVYKLLKYYEKEGYLTLKPWIRVGLDFDPSIFNPNLNIEFRNQAAAQTDCLLYYKEAAQFITFVDLDDILIPRLGNTYAEEFQLLFEKHTTAGYLHYAKENAHVYTHRKGSRFGIETMLRSVQFEAKTETGKFVTRPSYINSTWIHWPTALPEGKNGFEVPRHLNAILHVKKLSRVIQPQDYYDIPMFQPITGHSAFPLFKESDISAIRDDFKRLQMTLKYTKLLSKMPTDFIYRQAIDACFEETFYTFHYSSRFGRIKCPGPERCKLPANPGIRCMNAMATWNSKGTKDLIIYYNTDNGFEEADQCNR